MQLTNAWVYVQTVEKFFSVAVTHVVTTREIPPEGTVRLATEVPATRTTQSNGTIDPSLLRNHGRELLQSKHDLASRGAQVLRRNKVVNNRTYADTLSTSSAEDANFGRRTIHEDGRDRRPARGSSDILVKAREYGMKLWSMDKLQRMMTAMYENEGSQVQAASKILQHQHHAVPEKEINLSHLLRNERLHGPSDRDPKAMSRDMVVFKGPFLYIRDMKSTHRPIMVREYQAVAKREEGDWPQFRSSQTGKCPFIDEHMLMKEREYQREYQREQQALKEATELQARRRAKELEEKLTREKNMQPPRANKQRALDELAPHDNRPNFGRLSAISGQPIPTKLFDVPPVVPAKRQAAREMSNEIAFTSKNGKAAHGQHYQNQKYAYEPAASGVQPSKLTSAIRSNIVSSHLDAPGVKAGLSKDMYELKRKVAGNVMERKPSVSSLAQVHRATDLRTVSSKEELSRNRAEAVVRKPSINEKVEPAMNKVMNADMETDAAGKKAQEVRRWEKEEDRRESRSGYCENCREKFEDLDEHQHSRRHQRFAMNDANFAELDALLSQLQRPLKKQTIRR